MSSCRLVPVHTYTVSVRIGDSIPELRTSRNRSDAGTMSNIDVDGSDCESPLKQVAINCIPDSSYPEDLNTATGPTPKAALRDPRSKSVCLGRMPTNVFSKGLPVAKHRAKFFSAFLSTFSTLLVLSVLLRASVIENRVQKRQCLQITELEEYARRFGRFRLQIFPHKTFCILTASHWHQMTRRKIHEFAECPRHLGNFSYGLLPIRRGILNGS